MDTDIITTTIPRFVDLTGVSRSKVYELLTDGRLESIYIDGRRLVIVDSYRRLIDRQRSARPSASPPTPRP